MNDSLIDVFCICYSYLDIYSSFITSKVKDNFKSYNLINLFMQDSSCICHRIWSFFLQPEILFH